MEKKKYSNEFEISITELVSYPLPIKRQRKIRPDAVGALKEDIERIGQLEAITISSQKVNGKHLIYKGNRRTQAFTSLVKDGHEKFKTIRARKLLDDDNKRSVRREVYASNNDGEPWYEGDMLDIIALEYPKAKFLQNYSGAPQIGKKKEASLAQEIAEDWAFSLRTAYRWIDRVVEHKGWAVDKQKKTRPYPLLEKNDFKFAQRVAKEYIAAEKRLALAQKGIDKAMKEILDHETKVMKRNEFLAFVEDVKNKKARHA
ncbi:chromosome partitioning protein ParB [Leptospira gomenensis]|uniref:Chromosome partitioning protein ParB n=1 Tax=Leptospira gomenensis TaxID=2484974 RepID=A0A5F1YDS0_9LEPT|nr:chromosome partitioning protein ParB [Leptospira gomenensis]TGK36211.1 chromosome partitioning protein ParB [Leptospira gomenensis]TGK42751.1 chromosome partitioning protein ParB [Leptospira gomenensis]TGK42938.1 chromosome partitioning protein ParB [Leptospira gomenensis]TGK54950.1 chromosome partitioning protein ParB [Leptospira gomenensis]